MNRLLCLAVSALACAIPFAAAPSASAATPIDPVIVLIGPSISSECDAAALLIRRAAVLQPSLSPVLTPLLPVLGPVVSICGTVPYNPSPSVCSFDIPMQAAVVNALVAAGVPIPVRFHPIGGAVDQVGVIESKGPTVLNLGVAAALGNTLTCTRLVTSPNDLPAGTPTAPNANAGTDSDALAGLDLGGDFGAIPSLGDLGALGDLDGSLDLSPRLTAPASTTRQVHVSYPMAWLIPLVLLIGVFALGHLFTRDMRDVP